MKFAISLFLCLFLFNCKPATENHNTKETNLFKTPPDSLQLFGEGIISTRHAVRDIAISPNGNEIFYTLAAPKSKFSAILYIKKEAGTWTEPQIAPFSGNYRDLEPAFTSDGQKLFFASKRPVSESGEPKDFDIWVTQRTETGWSTPENIGAPINTEKDEYYPSPADNGNLYFTASYKDAKGLEDIYVSEFLNEEYSPPKSLDTTINTRFYEFNAFVSPDESYLLFSSYGRKDGLGGGDLYISHKTENGNWGLAKNMGPPINSASLDYCPFVSFDGKYFFFTSERSNLPTHFSTRINKDDFLDFLENPTNGTGNIYWINNNGQLTINHY